MNKNYIVLIGLLFTGLFSNAQQRTQIANFSQFQQYYNPALTGNEGSMVKSFYRDHFDGSDEAPKTLFVAGELNLADIGGKAGTEGALTHALGLSLLNDNYGSLKNNRIALSYNSGFKLTTTLRLHAGAAVTYDVNKFDNEGLVFDGPDDQSALNESINKLGVNAGVAVRAADYYIGYALTDLVEENLSDNTIFQDLYAQGAARVTAQEYPQAAALYEETAPLARELKDARMELECWRMASWCREVTKEPERAWEHGQRAWEVGRAMDEGTRETSTLPYVAEALVRLSHERQGAQAARAMESEVESILGKDWRPETPAAGGQPR